MAVLQMERIQLTAMKRDRKKILELLQRRGLVEVRQGPGEDEVFARADTSATRALFEKNAQTAEQAIEILTPYADEKKPSLAFLRGREAVTLKTNDAFVRVRDTVQKVAYRAVQLQREAAEANAEILRLEARMETFAPWLELPVAHTFAGTKKTAAFIGSIEGEYTLEGLLAALAEAAPGLDRLHVEIVSASREQTCFYLLVLKQDAAAAEEALRAIGFTRPPSPAHHKPADTKRRLEGEVAEAQRRIETIEEELAGYTGRLDDLRFLQDHMRMRAEKYDVIEKLAQSKHVFVLSGYVPAKYSAALQKELADSFECAVDVSAVPEGEEAPVYLENNWFARPTESVLESYGMPTKTDIDPTPVMSVFYYLMFGLMFSDAGYGAIIAGVCGVCLLVFKNMEDNWKKNLWMFFWCGVSTMFWGILFSSYFGDLLAVVSGTFFGRPFVLNPLWLDPLKDPMTLLVFCLGLGIVHLSFGMVLKIVTCVKNRQFIDIVYDVVFPLMLIYPLIMLVVASDMFEGIAGFKLGLSSLGSTLCFAVAGAGLVGMTLTGGRESKNWVKRLLKGVYAVYNTVTGWMGDILSYARLLALGLATGAIAQVVNSMGSMPAAGGNYVVGLIAFVLIFLVGHALNFGINVLGAYVHSNRLEYVEFFGKFYEGGGQKFQPFGIHTKYYKIKEETHNV